ncbi:MAG: hypothetical protein ABL962_01340 [Fimbriimonadaceae bacterium]
MKMHELDREYPESGPAVTQRSPEPAPKSAGKGRFVFAMIICLLVWGWWLGADRPPYRFMRGGQLKGFDTPPNPLNPMANTGHPGQAEAEYNIPRPTETVLAEARIELLNVGFEDVTSRWYHRSSGLFVESNASRTYAIYARGQDQEERIWIGRTLDGTASVEVLTPIALSDYMRHCVFDMISSKTDSW